MNFKGNVSFANNDPSADPDDGTFSLTSSAHRRRHGDIRPGGRALVELQGDPDEHACDGRGELHFRRWPDGHSTIRNPDPNPARPDGVDVDLVDGDVVTCTFTNTFIPPVGLVVRKITRGGSGSFPIDVSGFTRFTLTTAQAGTPAQKTLDAQPGSTHTITETLPASDAGTWVAESAACGGATVPLVRRNSPDTAQITVTLPQTGSQVCTFTNRFIPHGVIRIHKVTRGGTATATFYVQPQFGTPVRRIQRATTTAPGTPASRSPPLPPTRRLRSRSGRYTIQELSPFVDNGTWNLVAVVCDGVEPEPAAGGAIQIALTADDPRSTACSPTSCKPNPGAVAAADARPGPPVITELPPPQIQVAGVTAQLEPGPEGRPRRDEGRQPADRRRRGRRELPGDGPQPRPGERPRRHHRRGPDAEPAHPPPAREQRVVPGLRAAVLRPRNARPRAVRHGPRDRAGGAAGRFVNLVAANTPNRGPHAPHDARDCCGTRPARRRRAVHRLSARRS